MQGNRIPPAAVSDEQVRLGEVIRQFRVQDKKTQEALGFEAGLHRNYIGAIERGEINPTFRTLLRLTTGLGVTLTSIIARYENQPPIL